MTVFTPWSSKLLSLIGLGIGLGGTIGIATILPSLAPDLLLELLLLIGGAIAFFTFLIAPAALGMIIISCILWYTDSQKFNEFAVDTLDSEPTAPNDTPDIPFSTVCSTVEQTVKQPEVKEAIVRDIIEIDSDKFKIKVETEDGAELTVPTELPNTWNQTVPIVQFLEDTTNGSIAHLRGQTVHVLGNNATTRDKDLGLAIPNKTKLTELSTDEETGSWRLLVPREETKAKQKIFSRLPRPKVNKSIAAGIGAAAGISIGMAVVEPFVLIGTVLMIGLMFMGLIEALEDL